MLAFSSVRPVFAFLGKFFEVRRASGRAALQDWLEIVILGLVFLVGALTAPTSATGTPNGPGQHWLEQRTGGGVCLLRRATGIDCPGCGLSRGFVQLEHGHPVEAVKLNPLTPIVFFLLASRLGASLILCTMRLDVRNRLPRPMAWRLWGILFASFTSLGVYRVILRFI